MAHGVLRWLRAAVTGKRTVPLPPVMLPPLPRPAPRPRPTRSSTLAATPTFNPDAPLPAPVREYQEVFDRRIKMWNGGGLDGAIESYRALTIDLNKQNLLDAYLQLLRNLADPSPTTRIDFHALPQGARPYLLGPYLGTLVGHAYPRLCWQTSAPSKGWLTYIFPGGPADLMTWRQRMPDICAWLGAGWTLGPASANTITLIRRHPLPEIIPFTRLMLKPGSLFLGIETESQSRAWLPFTEMTSGTFIPGASGTGKSNALHIIVQSLLANLSLFEAVYLIDGKDGVAFNRYRNAAPGKVHVLWQDADVWQLMTDLTGLMRRRNEAQREKNIDNATSDFIAVVIDEMATFTAKPSVDAKHPDNKRHAQFVDELTMLARRGRSTGLRLIISAQEPVIEQIPASVRANCLTTLAFRLPMDAHATAVFGQLDSLPADPRRLLRGRALLKDGLSGEVRQVQFPVIRKP
ncbi:MAG: hypothetical protein JSR99_18930 [Proteobacteria bacterium]|nr:hypothetical protein [Pseudomonadota bacterium]